MIWLKQMDPLVFKAPYPGYTLISMSIGALDFKQWIVTESIHGCVG